MQWDDAASNPTDAHRKQISHSRNNVAGLTNPRNPDGSLYESFGLEPATQKRVSVAIGDASTGNNGSSPVVILNETAWQQQFHNGGDITLPGSMPTSTSTVCVLDHHVS